MAVSTHFFISSDVSKKNMLTASLVDILCIIRKEGFDATSVMT